MCKIIMKYDCVMNHKIDPYYICEDKRGNYYYDIMLNQTSDIIKILPLNPEYDAELKILVNDEYINGFTSKSHTIFDEIIFRVILYDVDIKQITINYERYLLDNYIDKKNNNK